MQSYSCLLLSSEVANTYCRPNTKYFTSDILFLLFYICSTRLSRNNSALIIIDIIANESTFFLRLSHESLLQVETREEIPPKLATSGVGVRLILHFLPENLKGQLSAAIYKKISLLEAIFVHLYKF